MSKATFPTIFGPVTFTATSIFSPARGGAVLLSQAHAGRSPFERLVLTAPMIRFGGFRYPGAVRWLVEILDIIGLGSMFVPGGSARAVLSLPFEQNFVTTDPVRYSRLQGIIKAMPPLAIGYPTVGWLNAAFRCTKQFEEPEFPLRTLTPTLVIASGGDRIVDTRAAERFSHRLKAGSIIVVPHAQHEILAERDVFLDQFWAAFDAFIPGEAVPSDEGLRAPGSAA